MKALVDISRNNWLQKIPTKWEIFRIKNLFQLSQEKNQGEDLPVLSLAQSGIRTRDISTNEGQLAESYENYTRIRPDDLVFNPMDLRSGAIDLSTYDGVISLAYSVLRKRSGVNIHLKYFKYYFQWHYLDEIFFPFGQGVSADHRWTLKDNILLNFPVLFPPLETQKRIVDFLDEKTEVIDELVAKKEKLIELLREKRAALITRAVTKGLDPNAKLKPSGIDWLGNIPVGWGVKPLKFLFSYQAGGIWGEEERFDKNDMICIRVADFDFLSFTTHSDEYTRRNLPEIKKSFLLDERSVLLEKSGGGDQSPVGRAVRYVGNEKATCSNFIQKLEINSGFNTEFVVYLLATLYFLGVTRKAIKQTTGIQNLDLGYFFRTPVFYPPTDEQKKIAQYINTELEKIIDTLEKIESQIEKLKEYRSSLIYHAVTGKIKV